MLYAAKESILGSILGLKLPSKSGFNNKREKVFARTAGQTKIIFTGNIICNKIHKLVGRSFTLNKDEVARVISTHCERHLRTRLV